MFDTEREGTGTREWSEHTENICVGCPNNCLYCYAAHNAHRFGLRSRDQWHEESLTRKAKIITYPTRDGVVMFPSSHDITPFNVESYVRVAKLILGKGNQLLIVSKPRLECIERLLVELEPWKEQILFRFTIGTVDPQVSQFWEPGASLPAERLESLRAARDAGYATSVSIEPMLSGRFGATETFLAVLPFVSETVWIGKMNRALLRVGPENKEAVENVLEMQRDAEIVRLVDDLKAYPQIRWKDSVKDVLAKHVR